MDVQGFVYADELVRAVKALGGTVTFPGDQLPQKLISLEVEVDNQVAYDALPSRFFDHLTDEDHDFADPFDVRDFSRALARGDKLVVEALAPRIFCMPDNQIGRAHV